MSKYLKVSQCLVARIVNYTRNDSMNCQTRQFPMGVVMDGKRMGIRVCMKKFLERR